MERSKSTSIWSKLFKNDLQGMLVPVIVLTFIGSINIFSATYVSSISSNDGLFGGLFGFFPKHLIFLAITGLIGILAYKIDYRKFQNPIFRRNIMFAVALLLILVKVIGTTINGAQRWIILGPISIQPSEFAKLAAIIWTASLLGTHKWRKPRPRRGREEILQYIGIRFGYMLPLLAWPVVFGGLTMLQPDMGTSVLIVMFSYMLIFLAGFDAKFFAATTLGLLPIGFMMARFSPYRWERLLSWFDPWSHAQDMGYQTVQGLLAVGSGGFLGQGFMQGTSKYFYLPEAHTDFAFAVWAQEFGFVGGIIVIAMIVMFTVYGMRIASEARDDFGRWLATGITMLISGQALFNIAMVCGVMPVTGVPLPFISYGGSSLLINFVAVGILGNIARRNVVGVKQIGKKEQLPSLREETQSRFRPNSARQTISR